MDAARFLAMSRKELSRLEILGRVLERRLTQVQMPAIRPRKA